MNIKLGKKSIITLIICSAVFFILACTLLVWYFSSRINSKIFLYSRDSQEICTLNSGGEKIKLINDDIDNNIVNINYSSSLGRYIAVDDENIMYFITKKGEVKKMADDISSKNIQAQDSGKVYYIGSDNRLYYKKEIGVKTQVKTDILDYYILNDNESLYIDLNDNLFYEMFGYNVSTISSNVKKIKISPDNKLIAYVYENQLYIENLSTKDYEKIADNICNGDFEFADNDFIVYFDNYNNDTGKGEIYYKKNGSDKVKAASDASSFVIDKQKSRKGIYYISADKTLNYKSFNGSICSDIMSDVQKITASSDGKSFFACNSSNDIYKVDSQGSLQKISENAASFKPGEKNMIILDKNNNLYFGNTKIADNVQAYDVNKNEIIYIDNENNIYIVKGKHGTKKLIGNTNDYKRVVFQDKLLYEGNMENQDITGYWRVFEYYTKYEKYYKFKDDGSVSIMDYNNPEYACKYSIKQAEPGKMLIDIDNQPVEVTMNEDRSINLKYSDGSVVELKRATEEDYDDAKDVIDKVYYEAEELYGKGNAEFKCVKTVKDFEYYLYGNKYSNGMEYKTQIYIDKYGSSFIVNGDEDAMKPLLEKDKY